MIEQPGRALQDWRTWSGVDKRRYLQRLQREQGRHRREVPAFQDWLPLVTPEYTWTWPHLRLVLDVLAQVTAGEQRRVIIEMPPRHGKSELVTVRYAAYRLERDPRERVMLGAYSQILANKFSRRTRRLVAGRLALSDERAAAEEWELPEGGGLRAAGVGGGITGQGADLVLLDDPVKSREEAESPAYRDRVWDWYTNDLYTRLEPGAAIILIMTRWHQDDLAGRLLASEEGDQFLEIKLPAEAEPGDLLGRAVGAALCPERFDAAALQAIHRVLGNDYFALYQQHPTARGGGLFKEHWFLPDGLVGAVPAQALRVRWWDLAITEDGGDWTVGLLLARVGPLFYVEDVVRGQWAGTERDRRIRAAAARDAQRYGLGAVVNYGPQEPAQAGKSAAAAFIRLLAGYSVAVRVESGSKQLRAGPVASQAGAGNVKLLRAAWTAGFLQELCSFPGSGHDDQVDALANAFHVLAEDLAGLSPMDVRAVGDGPGPETAVPAPAEGEWPELEALPPVEAVTLEGVWREAAESEPPAAPVPLARLQCVATPGGQPGWVRLGQQTVLVHPGWERWVSRAEAEAALAAYPESFTLLEFEQGILA